MIFLSLTDKFIVKCNSILIEIRIVVFGLPRLLIIATLFTLTELFAHTEEEVAPTMSSS